MSDIQEMVGEFDRAITLKDFAAAGAIVDEIVAHAATLDLREIEKHTAALAEKFRVGDTEGAIAIGAAMASIAAHHDARNHDLQGEGYKIFLNEYDLARMRAFLR